MNVPIDFLSFRNFKTNLFVLPVFLVGAWLACQSWFLTAILFFVSVIPVHEMGHALMAWMGGRFAFPAGALVPSAALTFIAGERSLLFSIVFWGLLLFGAHRAYNEKLSFLLISFLGAFFVSVWLTFAPTNETLSTYISYGGIAGEFAIGAWLILSFYHQSFETLRWEFLRYPALGMGGGSFVHALTQWSKIKAGLELMPLGSAMSGDGAKDPHGDLNRLLSSGWSTAEITQRYLSLGHVCLTLILVCYFYYLTQVDEANKLPVNEP